MVRGVGSDHEDTVHPLCVYDDRDSRRGRRNAGRWVDKRWRKESPNVERSWGPHPPSTQLPRSHRSLGSGWTRAIKKAFLEEAGFESSCNERDSIGQGEWEYCSKKALLKTNAFLLRRQRRGEVSSGKQFVTSMSKESWLPGRRKWGRGGPGKGETSKMKPGRVTWDQRSRNVPRGQCELLKRLA